MSKTVVIYKSKTGFAKKYAQWISEELHCDLMENNGLKLSDIQSYDVIIYGGGLYAIGINGLKLIKNNYEALKDKKVIVFATGATPPREEDVNKVWEANFSEEQRNTITRFYLRGGFNFSELKKGDKLLISMLKKKLQNDKNPTEDGVGMLAAIDKPVDFTDKKNIYELVNYVKESCYE
ncbi:menaquinone-dependent protoporphyrinogen IX oxidase [Alkalibaculum bacchi]|uniref:Menaquinone-dependent protoporphyrinogen IX oxidase n=1 Tax=Alkalibaculum bacchi TaxID=645887 RepID=A0A366I3L5_9FIRM|nr:flavodoxin domain-containing protein [Alkalibaculum bacchi]RBP61028.1 menaquinone-dependent protoporphyrinogen IX oxidase [Alkalibaculum bacchi]